LRLFDRKLTLHRARMISCGFIVPSRFLAFGGTAKFASE
jgi:hypothetical protein